MGLVIRENGHITNTYSFTRHIRRLHPLLDTGSALVAVVACAAA